MRGTVPSDRTLGDRFGASVSMSGQVLAIGIPGDDAIAPDSGAVAVFYYSGSTWVQHQIFHWDQSSQEDQ